MLYEVAVVKIPTKEEKKKGKKEELLVSPKAVIADNDQAVLLTIGKEAKLESVDLNYVEVLVRPFAVKK